jgi:hypothetical protein
VIIQNTIIAREKSTHTADEGRQSAYLHADDRYLRGALLYARGAWLYARRIWLYIYGITVQNNLFLPCQSVQLNEMFLLWKTTDTSSV